jgi:signal transduction histidine kinase
LINILRKQRLREILFAQTAPAIFVALAFLALTFNSYATANRENKMDGDNVVRTQVNDAQINIQERIETYEDILLSGAGLFGASENVTRAEWGNFINNFNIPERYPGVQGIGYIKIINQAELNNHVQNIRSNDYPGYEVFPIANRDLYAPVLYIEPLNEPNKKALGFDLNSEQTRRAGLEQARDTNSAILTDIVTIIQDDPMQSQPGFIMFLPVYKPGSVVDTVEKRKENITGYVYAPFRSYDLLSKLTPGNNDKFGFEIYAESEYGSTLIYKSENFDKNKSLKSNYATSSSFTINNKTWKIVGVASPSVIPDSQREAPVTSLLGGILFSFFAGGFLFLLLTNRVNINARREAQQIQEAKDELLALASHQLRTPATGVKQYLGMLIEEYVGKINKDQRKLLEKAYSSNERQLKTINDMLLVARTESTTIELNINSFNFSELVRQTLEERSDSIKHHHHTLIINMPKKDIKISGDKQYLRMAVENIISNAIKYTPDGGSLEVILKKHKETIELNILDTGVGVEEENLPLLFRRFSRIPNNLSEHVSGNGLGLYLVEKIIKAHQGSVKFDSIASEGSMVTITIPIKLSKKLNMQ